MFSINFRFMLCHQAIAAQIVIKFEMEIFYSPYRDNRYTRGRIRELKLFLDYSNIVQFYTTSIIKCLV